MLGFSPLATAPLSDDGLAEIGLAATSISVGSPSIGTADLNQDHVLAGTSIQAGAPSVASADINQVHTLAGNDISLGTPSVGSADIDQDHVLAGTTIQIGTPSVGNVDIDQDHVLSAALATGAPSVGSGPLEINIALSATSIAAGSPKIGGSTFLDYRTAASNFFTTLVDSGFNSDASYTTASGGYISDGYRNLFDPNNKVEVNNITADSTKLTLYAWVRRERYEYNAAILGWARYKLELYYSGSNAGTQTLISTTTTTSNPWGSTTVGDWFSTSFTSAVNTALSGKMTDYYNFLNSDGYVLASRYASSGAEEPTEYLIKDPDNLSNTTGLDYGSPLRGIYGGYEYNTAANGLGSYSARNNSKNIIGNRWLVGGSHAQDVPSNNDTKTYNWFSRPDPPDPQISTTALNLTLGTASNMPLQPGNITVSPTVGSADLDQVHILAADDLTVGAPTIVGDITSAPFDVSLDAADLTTGAPSVGSVTLLEDIPISVSLSASATLSNNYTYLMGAVVELSAESNLTNTFVGEVIRSHQSATSGLTTFTTLSSDQTSSMTWGSGAAGNVVTANFAGLSANSATSNLTADPILGNAGVAQLDAAGSSAALGGIDLPGVASLSVTSDLSEASVRDRPGVSAQSAATDLTATGNVNAAGISTLSSQSAGDNAVTSQMAGVSAISAAGTTTIISTISFNSTSAQSASGTLAASGKLRFEPVILPTVDPWSTTSDDGSSEDEATNPWTVSQAA